MNKGICVKKIIILGALLALAGCGGAGSSDSGSSSNSSSSNSSSNNVVAGAALWPDYLVFNSLQTGAMRELSSGTSALSDDMALYSASSASSGQLTFSQATHSPISVISQYSDGIAPLSGQLGNERFNAQIVTICTSGSAYVMLTKSATVVPLSELTGAAAMNMEQLGVSEGCPLTGASGSGPSTFQFLGNGGGVMTPSGQITASEFAAINGRSQDRFLAFKVSVSGQVRYGMIERGLDSKNGLPFLYLHVQKGN